MGKASVWPRVKRHGHYSRHAEHRKSQHQQIQYTLGGSRQVYSMNKKYTVSYVTLNIIMLTSSISS